MAMNEITEGSRVRLLAEDDATVARKLPGTVTRTVQGSATVRWDDGQTGYVNDVAWLEIVDGASSWPVQGDGEPEPCGIDGCDCHLHA
jgi:hypothetical protein